MKIEEVGWVDESRRPIEIDLKREDGTVTVLRDIRLNAPVEEAAFDMTAPADYRVTSASPQVLPDLWGSP
jgi:hypothetical protein